MPMLSMRLPSIEKFQFVQSKAGELTLLVAPKMALTPEQIQQLTERLNSVNPLVKVKLETLDYIEPATSGKHALFKSLNAREVS